MVELGTSKWEVVGLNPVKTDVLWCLGSEKLIYMWFLYPKSKIYTFFSTKKAFAFAFIWAAVLS